MKKIEQIQPKKLFRLVNKKSVDKISKEGFSEGLVFREKPPISDWPSNHVGALVHLDNSPAWASRDGRSAKGVWVLRSWASPEFINFYEQEE